MEKKLRQKICWQKVNMKNLEKIYGKNPATKKKSKAKNKKNIKSNVKEAAGKNSDV